MVEDWSRDREVPAGVATTKSRKWGMRQPAKPVASFGVDSEVQSIVELEEGGRAAFVGMMREGLFSPYT